MRTSSITIATNFLCLHICVSVTVKSVLAVSPWSRLIFTLPTRPVEQYCDECVCLCVCLSVCPRGYLRNHTRAIFNKFFVRAAYVHGSVLLRHIYDRPHRLSPIAGKGFSFPLKLHYRPGKGTQRERSRPMLSTIALFKWWRWACAFNLSLRCYTAPLQNVKCEN